MKMRLVVFGLVGVVALTLSRIPLRASQAPEGRKTVWDSIYSAAQATKGESLYNDKCARCHGPNGSGGDAPTLVGSDFATDWDGLSIDQLFDRTRNSMPQDDPGSLSREDTTALLAYIFQRNGFPAGDADLSSDSGAIHAIMYVANKP